MLATPLLLLVMSVSPAPGDEVRDMLARAEALYYEADFAKSIDLLLRADRLLGDQSGNLEEKKDVKLQLALSFIGLNDRTRAKAYLGELYALDADHQIDPQLFSPKVIQLAEEARTEQNEIRCRSLVDQAQQQLSQGKPDAVVRAIRSTQNKCAALGALAPKAADLFFKAGLDAYKAARMQDALDKFRSAVSIEPKHELAAEYVDLTLSKLEVAADRAQVRGEYRQTLSKLVDDWNRACAANDAAAMEQARLRINAMAPEASSAEDILSNMKSCTPHGCVQMSAPLALARLRNRVDPQFPAAIVSQLRGAPVTVRMKTKINESGEVAASEFHGGSPMLYPAIRDAVQQWKFSPAVTAGESRCVETEIPIVINFSPK